MLERHCVAFLPPAIAMRVGEEREGNRGIAGDFVYRLRRARHFFSSAQSGGFDFWLVKAAVGDGDDAIFAENVGRRADAGRPKGDGGVVEVARVIESRIADEIGVVAISLRAGRGESQGCGERRILQRAQRCRVYIGYDRSIGRQFAENVRWRRSSRRAGYGRDDGRERTIVPEVERCAANKQQDQQNANDNPGAGCGRHGHLNL